MAQDGEALHKSEVSFILGGARAWALKNSLPLAFLVAFIIAMTWPWLGQQVLQPSVRGVHIITFVNICIIFLISGLTLRTDEIKAALTRKTLFGTVFGFISIVGITPLLGFALRLLPLKPVEFATGLTIFAVVPTTLGVGISLSQSAKGNVGLAIFLTVATNVCGVVIIPLWLKAMLNTKSGGVENLNIDFADIFVKLLLSNFVPTVIGKLLREFVPPVQAFVKANRNLLSLTNNFNLAMIIWQTLSSARDLIVKEYFGTMLLVIVIALGIHCLFLTFNSLVVAAAKTPLPEAISTVIMASQKSAPVAVTVISYITPDPTTQGLLAVPAITGQLLQIFVGQPIANYLNGCVTRSQARAKAAETAETAMKLEAGGDLPSVKPV